MRFNQFEFDIFELMIFRFGIGINLFILERNRISEWVTLGIYFDKDGIYPVLFNKQYYINYGASI
jgi:hypothetical protein